MAANGDGNSNGNWYFCMYLTCFNCKKAFNFQLFDAFCWTTLFWLQTFGQEPAETDRSRHSQDSQCEDKNSNQPVDFREGGRGDLPKWLDLGSTDVLQRLLREAQHNQFSKHLQVDRPVRHQVILHSPRVHPAQSPPCPPPHVECHRHQAISPMRCRAAQASVATHQAHTVPIGPHPQLWRTAELPTPALFSQSPAPKIQPLEPCPRQHAKSMPEAQVRLKKGRLSNVKNTTSKDVVDLSDESFFRNPPFRAFGAKGYARDYFVNRCKHPNS